MADEQIDLQALERLADEKAAEKVALLKQDLVSSLSGQAAEQPPESWTSLKEEIKTNAVKEAEERILSKIEQQNQERQKSQEAEEAQKAQLTAKQQEEENRREWETMSAQWRDAVADGILPDISPEVKSALESGVTYDKLTPEQQQDPGLKAYNDARALHLKLKKEGKSSSFYRTVQKEFNKTPAGASAPVMGSTAAVSPSTGYTYEEVRANRIAKGL